MLAGTFANNELGRMQTLLYELDTVRHSTEVDSDLMSMLIKVATRYIKLGILIKVPQKVKLDTPYM